MPHLPGAVLSAPADGPALHPLSPQGSVYQKTNAMSEIKRVGKDSFWAKAEVSAAGLMASWARVGRPARTGRAVSVLLALSPFSHGLLEPCSGWCHAQPDTAGRGFQDGG